MEYVSCGDPSRKITLGWVEKTVDDMTVSIEPE